MLKFIIDFCEALLPIGVALAIASLISPLGGLCLMAGYVMGVIGCLIDDRRNRRRANAE